MRLVTTSDFDITLKAPTGVSFPYNQNNVLDKFLGGKIWMANDGGVYSSEDGGRSWKLSVGLNTVDAVNLAGLFGLGSAPALYMGCGDNDDFFTRDGGKTWKDPISSCGDCDAWFSDVAQPRRVLEFLPRDDRMFVINSPLLPAYPDATSLASIRAVPRPRSSNISSGFVIRGFRPVIQTLPNEAPLADGDYVFIGMKADGTRVVLRTLSISSITAQAHWDDPNKAQQIGPPVPGQADLVQVGGGHQAPVFFVGDASGHVWKLDAAKAVWNPIVPGGPPGRKSFFATRFFVDPYNPSLIYLVDSTEIRVSLDGGASWLPEPSLRKAVTAARTHLHLGHRDPGHIVREKRALHALRIWRRGCLLHDKRFRVVPAAEFDRLSRPRRVGLFRPRLRSCESISLCEPGRTQYRAPESDPPSRD